MKDKRWTDYDMCAFAGYYKGRTENNPKLTFAQILNEYEGDIIAARERILNQSKAINASDLNTNSKP